LGSSTGVVREKRASPKRVGKGAEEIILWSIRGPPPHRGGKGTEVLDDPRQIGERLMLNSGRGN